MSENIMEDKRILGKIYSPDYVVHKILDDVGYNSEEILGKSIIDISCGDGAFLKEIVNRIIQFSNKSDLVKNLENVYGWDIDANAITLCIKNLDQLIEPLGIEVSWNISTLDSIKKKENIEFEKKFDFIVGNPPYIRVHNITEEDRKYLRTHYKFCKNGAIDMYIAFMELSYNLLSENGVFGLITPNSYFHTESANVLRETFVNNRSIKQISNFLHTKLFENISTYTAITIVTNNKNEDFLYEEINEDGTFENKRYQYNDFSMNKNWQLSLKEIDKNIKGVQLKNICKINVGIATLCDKAFIFSTEHIDEDYCYAITKLKGKVKIEKSILKPIIKASKLKTEKQLTTQSILFPYKRRNEKFNILEEEDLKNNYPFAYQYLCSIKDELDKRDKGKGNIVAWYAFGRSQGLDSSFGKKIIFSPMNIKPNFILCEDEDTTFYSGYCIKYNGDYSELLREINSERMDEYVSVSSRALGSGWKTYSKKIIERFTVNIENKNHIVTKQRKNIKSDNNSKKISNFDKPLHKKPINMNSEVKSEIISTDISQLSANTSASLLIIIKNLKNKEQKIQSEIKNLQKEDLDIKMQIEVLSNAVSVVNLPGKLEIDLTNSLVETYETRTESEPKTNNKPSTKNDENSVGSYPFEKSQEEKIIYILKQKNVIMKAQDVIDVILSFEPTCNQKSISSLISTMKSKGKLICGKLNGNRKKTFYSLPEFIDNNRNLKTEHYSESLPEDQVNLKNIVWETTSALLEPRK